MTNSPAPWQGCFRADPVNDPEVSIHPRATVPIAALITLVFILVIGTQSIYSPARLEAGEAKCRTNTAPELRAFADKVWPLKRWERKQPKQSTKAAWRAKLRCAGPEHRKAGKHYWRKAKHKFYAYRAKRLRQRQHEAALEPPGLPTLEAIAACESGGDPTAVSADGSYRGKYQFDYGTWESVGGSGDPAAAPEWEQDERAAELYRRSGKTPWPICGV